MSECFRNRWLWLGGFLLVHLSFLACGQTVPTIDSATLDASRSQLRFQFQAAAGTPRDFQVYSAASVDAREVWHAEPLANVEAVTEDRYRALVPVSGAARFFRVLRLGPPPIAPAPVLNEVMTDNVSAYADSGGQFWDWVELYNPHDEAINLEGYGLTDDAAEMGKWRFPAVVMQPDSYLVVFASGLDGIDPANAIHTNFRIRASGETLRLSDPFGREMDRVDLPQLSVDQSAGRSPDGGDRWRLFGKAEATPGAANRSTTEPPLVEAPRLSAEGGFYDQPLELRITGVRAGEHIRYTTDGAPASVTATLFEQPFRIDRTTVVRAVAIDSLGTVSAETAQTYFIGARHSLPVVSLAALPSHFRFRDGYLYGMGSAVLNDRGEVLQSYPYSGSNAWRDREVEVHLEFYEPDGRLGFRQDAGLKIFGGWGSRGYPQKSLAVFARKRYGPGRFDYRVFPDQSVASFESLVLRNSGNDNQSTHQTPPRPPITEFGATTSYGSYFVNGTFTLMRDAMMQRLLDGTGLDTQAYRPAVLYVNGDYWGIYNLREKLTEAYVVSHHDLPKGKVDLIDGYGDARAGDSVTYRAMRDFLNTKSPAIASNYQFVSERYLAIDNFIDYHLAVIFFQNFDIGNIKCWRPRVPHGRFRWMVFDQDYGFNLWPPEVYLPAMARDYADYDNMFRFYTAGTGTSTGWPNAGGRTLLLRRMLLNPDFKGRFIRRCADLLNRNFQEDHIEAVIQSMAAVIRPEMAGHLQRWSWPELVKRGFGAPHQREYQSFTVPTWETNLLRLADFARHRPQKLRRDCAEHFGLSGGLGTIQVHVEPAGAGLVKVNTLLVEQFPWRGVYFVDYPTRLQPVAAAGYRFKEWMTPSGNRTAPDLDWTTPRDGTDALTARFEPVPSDAAPSARLWITEINYHSPDDLDADDWVEVYNPGTEAVKLQGWVLRDDSENQPFVFPEVTLAPGDSRVVCRSETKFQLVHPNAADVLGEFAFGLGNEGDTLRLYDPRGVLADQVTYDDRAPWPASADGDGSTLQLTLPDLDHSSPSAWSASTVRGGTPGGK